MVVDPPGTQLSHVTSPAKFVEVLDLICNIQVPDTFLKATEVSLHAITCRCCYRICSITALLSYVCCGKTVVEVHAWWIIFTFLVALIKLGLAEHVLCCIASPGAAISFSCCLCCLQLRLQGNAEARQGDLHAAELAYTKGIDLELSRGKHTLYANRSGVRLTLGNVEGALEDAQTAVKLGPTSFTTAYIRQVGRC